MRIGIAGYGYVGQAHEAALKDYHEILISDPALGHYANLRHADAIIVCVSTPQHETGACNINNVYEVIEAAPDVPILIKSTISLEGWRELRHLLPDAELTFSPEFLRAESALDDFKNSKHFLMGGDNTGFWAQLFIDAMGKIDVEIAEVEELILSKYFRNAFLATKVAFFNEIYDLCDKLDVEYSAVAHYTGMDERIGYSHTFVTEERGFGGHCLPKDTSAIVHTGNRNDVELSLIKQAIKYNTNIRKDHN
jgi:UDPglucose 6-dehydrogenase